MGGQEQQTPIRTQRPTHSPFQHRHMHKMLLKRLFSHFSTCAHRPTDGPTDRRTKPLIELRVHNYEKSLLVKTFILTAYLISIKWTVLYTLSTHKAVVHPLKIELSRRLNSAQGYLSLCTKKRRRKSYTKADREMNRHKDS